MKGLAIGRKLHEDDDFITLEIGKRDDVSFRLGLDEDLNTVGGDEFFTVLFVKANDDGTFSPWNPWEV